MGLAGGPDATARAPTAMPGTRAPTC